MMSARETHDHDGAEKKLPRRSLLRAAMWSVPATTLIFGAGTTAAGAASSFEFVPDQVVIPTIDSPAKVSLEAYQTNGTPIPAGETIFVGVSHGVRWADGTVYPRFFTLSTAGKLEIDGLRVENESVLPGIVTASYGTQKAVAYIILAPQVTEPTPAAIGAGHLYWWNEADGKVVKDVGQVCETWDQNPWGTIRTVMPIDIRASVLEDNRARDIWLYDGPQEYMGGLNKSEMDIRSEAVPVATGQQVRVMSSTRWGSMFYAWRYIDAVGKYGLCLYSTQAPLNGGYTSEPIVAKRHYFPQGKTVMTERSAKTVKDLAATLAASESSVQNPVPLVLFDDGELCTVAGVWSPFSTVVVATGVAAIAHVNRGGAFRFARSDGQIGTYSFTETAVTGNVNTGATSYSSQKLPGTPIAISWNDSTEPFVLLSSGDLYYAPTNVTPTLVASNVSAIERYGMRSGGRNGIFYGTNDGKLWEWFTGSAAPTQIGAIPGTPKSLYHWGANGYYALSAKGAFHRISGGEAKLVTDKYVTAVPIQIAQDASGKDVVRFGALSGQSFPRCEIYR